MSGNRWSGANAVVPVMAVLALLAAGLLAVGAVPATADGTTTAPDRGAGAPVAGGTPAPGVGDTGGANGTAGAAPPPASTAGVGTASLTSTPDRGEKCDYPDLPDFGSECNPDWSPQQEQTYHNCVEDIPHNLGEQATKDAVKACLAAANKNESAGGIIGGGGLGDVFSPGNFLTAAAPGVSWGVSLIPDAVKQAGATAAERQAKALLDGLVKEIEAGIGWLLFGLVRRTVEVFDFFISRMTRTPHPSNIGGAPTDAPFNRLYQFRQQTILPLAVTILLVQWALVYGIGNIAPLFSQYSTGRLHRRLLLALMGIMVQWPFMGAALGVSDAIGRAVAPGGDNILAAIGLRVVESLGGAAVLVILLVLVEYTLGALAVLFAVGVFMAREVLIFMYMAGMPLLIAFWPVDTFVFGPLSSWSEKQMKRFVPVALFSLPAAFVLRIATEITPGAESVPDDPDFRNPNGPGAEAEGGGEAVVGTASSASGGTAGATPSGGTPRATEVGATAAGDGGWTIVSGLPEDVQAIYYAMLALVIPGMAVAAPQFMFSALTGRGVRRAFRGLGGRSGGGSGDSAGGDAEEFGAALDDGGDDGELPAGDAGGDAEGELPEGDPDDEEFTGDTGSDVGGDPSATGTGTGAGAGGSGGGGGGSSGGSGSAGWSAGWGRGRHVLRSSPSHFGTRVRRAGGVGNYLRGEHLTEGTPGEDGTPNPTWRGRFKRWGATRAVSWTPAGRTLGAAVSPGGVARSATSAASNKATLGAAAGLGAWAGGYVGSGGGDPGEDAREVADEIAAEIEDAGVDVGGAAGAGGGEQVEIGQESVEEMAEAIADKQSADFEEVRQALLDHEEVGDDLTAAEATVAAAFADPAAPGPDEVPDDPDELREFFDTRGRDGTSPLSDLPGFTWPRSIGARDADDWVDEDGNIDPANIPGNAEGGTGADSAATAVQSGGEADEGPTIVENGVEGATGGGEAGEGDTIDVTAQGGDGGDGGDATVEDVGGGTSSEGDAVDPGDSGAGDDYDTPNSDWPNRDAAGGDDSSSDAWSNIFDDEDDDIFEDDTGEESASDDD